MRFVHAYNGSSFSFSSRCPLAFVSSSQLVCPTSFTAIARACNGRRVSRIPLRVYISHQPQQWPTSLAHSFFFTEENLLAIRCPSRNLVPRRSSGFLWEYWRNLSMENVGCDKKAWNAVVNALVNVWNGLCIQSNGIRELVGRVPRKLGPREVEIVFEKSWNLSGIFLQYYSREKEDWRKQHQSFRVGTPWKRKGTTRERIISFRMRMEIRFEIRGTR